MNQNYMVEAVVMDADFAIKIGRFKNIKIIEEVVPLLVKKLYIHRHVYENEILIPPLVREQVSNLVQKKQAFIVDREFIQQIDPKKLIIYDTTITLLKDNLEGTVEKHKNWGEIVSLAFAIGITIFLSDEQDLQDIIDEYLNIGDSETPNAGDINVIRIEDFVIWMKDAGLERKTAKWVWIASGKPREVFQKYLWPI